MVARLSPAADDVERLHYVQSQHPEVEDFAPGPASDLEDDDDDPGLDGCDHGEPRLCNPADLFGRIAKTPQIHCMLKPSASSQMVHSAAAQVLEARSTRPGPLAASFTALAEGQHYS